MLWEVLIVDVTIKMEKSLRRLVSVQYRRN